MSLDALIKSIINAPVSFFERSLTGTIINRFTVVYIKSLYLNV